MEFFEEETVKQWVCEIKDHVKDIDEEDQEEKAWDDVKDAELDVKEVRAARRVEVGYMEGRNIWTVVSESESWTR